MVPKRGELQDSRNDAYPRCLITVDAEGDNLWSRPRRISTQNAKFLPRFQVLCETYGLKPTYLTNFEMAESLEFQELGRDIIKRGCGEIGMHLHAWNSPPLFPLTSDDYDYHPYLIEYPEYMIKKKVAYLTGFLEDSFGTKMTSHRAGRWSFNEAYARILVENGYRVDSSVTPHRSWKGTLGDPSQIGGSDYSQYPEAPYMVNLSDISQSGNSRLLEIPVTIRKIVFRRKTKITNGPDPFLLEWVRPNGRNLNSLLRMARRAETERECLVFMIHSSELMPGGSPTFRTPEDIESLYEDLETFFSAVSETFKGVTLTEFYRELQHRHPQESSN